MVNVAPGFDRTPLMPSGYADLILELYGPAVGMHARSSIGMMIPLNAPVNCEAEWTQGIAPRCPREQRLREGCGAGNGGRAM